MQIDVAATSRSLALAVLLCGSLAARAPVARAQEVVPPPAPSARPIVPPLSVLPRRAPVADARVARAQPSYFFRGQLALAYLAPLAAFAGIALVADKDNTFVPILLGLAGLSAPPFVHALNNDKAGAGWSLVGMVGGGAVGALTGAAIGRIGSTDATRARTQRRDAAIFGVCGYTIWALLDISFFAFTHRDPKYLSTSLVPSMALDSRGRERPRGLELRVRGRI